ncbi:MAG: tRNA1(Val) (adenine(37)-N6)-methyltransferase [Clostridia bacterium]|nr:tRNA1(Val) (adenine(37)-N6)-methyltransferase [Clostridia bacterium]
MELKNNERIDDLQWKDLKIIQNINGFRFGIDAVLLANFAKGMKRSDFVVDLCTGTGIIPILLSGKTNAKKIAGVEIQEEYADMARRSVLLNGIEDRIEIIHKDLNLLNREIRPGTVDSVTVNPPYKKKGSGIMNEVDALTVARHEIYCTLEDVIKEASRILKTNGSFYMVHRPERLVDIFCLMRQYHIEPKRIKFVYPSVGKVANIVLIEGTKNGGVFLKFEKPLYVYDENGNYTNELYEFEGK